MGTDSHQPSTTYWNDLLRRIALVNGFLTMQWSELLPIIARFARRSIHLIDETENRIQVGDSVKRYTVDALIGGSPTDDPKLIKKAEKRIKEAKIVFTTCAGAGLGVLRKLNFTVVLIDEASQITEGVALIPLVKGCQKAIMVGDQ